MMASVVGLGVPGALRLPISGGSRTRPARYSAVQVTALARDTGDGPAAPGASAPAGPLFPAPPSVASVLGPLLGRARSASLRCSAGDSGTGGGSGSGNGGNGGSGGGDGGDDGEEEEFLDLAAAEELAAAKGVELPADWAATAAEGGLRRSVLTQYAAIASGGALTSALARSVPAFRDRLIADRLYFFKILAEVCIDSACATVAEVRKRGEEFWDEFEFYLSDLVVGLVLDVVLVTLLAPVAVAGRERKVAPRGLRRWASQLPSAVFEKAGPGRAYSFTDRVGCYVARAMEYSLAGMACGVAGQGVASGLMVAKRRYLGAQEGDVEVPPVLETGLVWGAFMALSANTRYQIVAGLERVVEETVARRVPGVAYLTTTVIRFINNIIGGEQFIDMARWAGIQ